MKNLDVMEPEVSFGKYAGTKFKDMPMPALLDYANQIDAEAKILIEIFDLVREGSLTNDKLPLGGLS